MINEHTPNSALINEIARYAPNRPEHQVAAAEYDKRFPASASAPVDRKTLDCFTHCQVGDEVEWRGSHGNAPREWKRGRVTKVVAAEKYGGKRCVDIAHIEGGPAIHGARFAEHIRWPQPAPWYEALKPGDEYEVNISRDTWERRVLVKRDDHGLWSDRGLTYFRWCRPLPPAAPVVDGEYTAERYAASQKVAATWMKEAGRLGMLVGERDATIAAKDAEIAKLRAYNGNQADTMREVDAKLAACESLLKAERATVSRQADSIRNLKSQGDEKYHRVVVIANALGVVATQDAILAAITDLRASALVVPVEVLKVHPLPWKANGRCIRDMDGRAVIVINFTGYQDEKAIASAIVKAANAGGAK